MRRVTDEGQKTKDENRPSNPAFIPAPFVFLDLNYEH